MLTVKHIVALLCAVTVIAAATGCASGGTSSGASNAGSETSKAVSNGASSQTPAAGDTVNLEYYIWSDEISYITKVVDAFNGGQDAINVNLTSIPNDDYDDKLKVLLSGGANLDVMGIRGTAQVLQFRETGSLLEVTDSIKSSGLDVSSYGAMFNTITPDNRHFALPTRSTCWILIYNPDLFDKAGLDYPGQLTWSEYRELAKKLTMGSGMDKQWGGYWVPWIFHFAAVQQGVYLNDDDLSKVKDSIELLNAMYNEDKTHMSFAEMKATDSNWIAEFENGNIAMMPNGEWFVGMIKADEESGKSDVKWELAPMPVPDGVEAGTTWGQYEFAAIHSKTSYPDQAFSFLKYLCGPEGSAIYASSGMIHAYISGDSEAAYKASVGKDSTSVFFNAKKVQEQPVDSKYDEIRAAFNEHVELYLLGEKNADETMQNFMAQREAIANK